MKFKDLKVNQRFRFVFVDNYKIYTKINEDVARRNLADSFVWWDAEVELVSYSEEENHEEIDKRSVHSHLIRKYVNGAN